MLQWVGFIYVTFSEDNSPKSRKCKFEIFNFQAIVAAVEKHRIAVNCFIVVINKANVGWQEGFCSSMSGQFLLPPSCPPRCHPPLLHVTISISVHRPISCIYEFNATVLLARDHYPSLSSTSNCWGRWTQGPARNTVWQCLFLIRVNTKLIIQICL